MPVYASPTDLPEGVEASEAELLLASALVDEAALTARYRVDDEGLPVDPSILARFRAATVAQVTYWHELGIDPVQGAAGVVSQRQASSKSIGSASVAYESGEARTQARVDALRALGPAAAAALGALTRGPVIVRG
ncbi:hypothetical protein ACTXMZ_16500 [Brachybacterium alimentarium]|uniref:hypothetical protein n=1 Tax=Brachybacterium alimentarium TaxID=47845 RepID=UPI003FD296E5